MRVLVTGAAGFLGWHVARELARRGDEVVGTSRDGAGMPDGVRGVALELADGGAAAARRVDELRPEAIVHCAAMGDPDACARDPEGARTVNAVASGALARAASSAGAWLLYVSTDLVFDGTTPPYAEGDPTHPLGPYMATKEAGERETLRASPTFLVCRTALLYGFAGGRKGGFTDAFARRWRAGEAVPLFVDQFRTPIEVGDAAELYADLVRQRPGGCLHLGGPERVSRYEHGRALADALGVAEELCRPARVEDLPGLAPRPADVSLKIDRLIGTLGRTPLGVVEGCRRAARAAGSAC